MRSRGFRADREVCVPRSAAKKLKKSFEIVWIKQLTREVSWVCSLKELTTFHWATTVVVTVGEKTAEVH